MERNKEVDKYTKAKIEEPNPILPDFLQKSGGISTDNHFFMINFGSEVPSGAETVRKVYRIHNEDLLEILGENCENMKQIHNLTNATIAIVADDETHFHNQSYIDFVGTDGQVRAAEERILDDVFKTYDSPVYPVILMPPTVHWEQVTMPLYKPGRFIGPNGCNIAKLEIESRTWIMIDNGPTGGSALDRVVSIYGPQENVTKALSLIQSTIHKPVKSSEAEKDIDELFSKLQCGEKSDETSEPKKGKKLLQAASGSAQTDKYAKEKSEDPTQLLPKTLLIEDDYRKTQTLAEAVAAGAKTAGKLYRICYKHLFKALGEEETEPSPMRILQLPNHMLILIFEKLYRNNDDRKNFLSLSQDFLKAGCIHLWKLKVESADLLTCMVPESPNLREISFSKALLKDHIELIARSCPKVEKLDIPLEELNMLDEKFDIDDALCKLGKSCVKLQKVNLSRRIVGNEAVISIVRSSKNLKELHLSGCVNVMDEALKVIGEESCLKLLDLSSCTSITDLGLNSLTGGSLKSSLVDLNLSGCATIGDNGILGMSNMRALEDLNLSGCMITDKSLFEIDRCLNLKCIELLGCRSITDEGLWRAFDKLPDEPKRAWITLDLCKRKTMRTRDKKWLRDGFEWGIQWK